VLTCARKEEELQAALAEWAAAGLAVSGIVADVSDRQQAAALVDKAREQFGGQLHVLVNNVSACACACAACGICSRAALVPRAPRALPRPPHTASAPRRRRLLLLQVGTNVRKATVEYSAEDFRFIMGTNLESGYALCQACHPLLKAAGGGAVVFNSSVAGGPTAMRCGGLPAWAQGPRPAAHTAAAACVRRRLRVQPPGGMGCRCSTRPRSTAASASPHTPPTGRAPCTP
jgi:Tropinone reductase 1